MHRKAENERRRSYTLSLPPEIVVKIDTIAEGARTSRSHVCEKLLNRGLKYVEPPEVTNE